MRKYSRGFALAIAIFASMPILAQDEPQSSPPGPALQEKDAHKPVVSPPPRPGKLQDERPKVEGTCQGRCACPAEGGAHTMMARLCACGNLTDPCNHASLCSECGKRQNACLFCGKSLAPRLADRIQKELDASFGGHRVGRELPNKLCAKLLRRVKFFFVFHPESPCKTCDPNVELLAIVEYREDGDRTGSVRILGSAAELEALLRRQELKGGAEAALCAAQLVQALWHAAEGSVQPSDVEAVKLVGDGATFEFRKGRATAKLRVVLTLDGAFERFRFDDER